MDEWDLLLAEMDTPVESAPTFYTTQSHVDDCVVEKQVDRVNVCYSCGGEIRLYQTLLTCLSCGLEIVGGAANYTEESSSMSASDNNVNDKGFISMRIVGKGSYGLNRNLLKSCADYIRYRKMTTLKEMNNWNSQQTTNMLPKNIIEEANDMFATIKEHGIVYRKDVKKGVQGKCLYYVCHAAGISKTPAEIAQFVGISEKFLSAGDRILRDLHERRIITIPEYIDSIPSYVHRYFELLSIPTKYMQFVLDIIRQADKKKLHVLHDSKNVTKCVGSIYLLIERTELRDIIDKDTIESTCAISKTTFIKYYNMLCKFYKLFAHIFAAHGIKMKAEWRDTYVQKKRKRKINVAQMLARVDAHLSSTG
jgi:transcription initiation factor TFIIIB Brf1 subunit/transcription initiation factor TFIIB